MKENRFAPIKLAVCRVAIPENDYFKLDFTTTSDPHSLGYYVADKLGLTKLSNVGDGWTFSTFVGVVAQYAAHPDYYYVDLFVEAYIGPRQTYNDIRDDVTDGKFITVSLKCTIPGLHTSDHVVLRQGNRVTEARVSVENPKPYADLLDKGQTDYEEILNHYPEISGIVDSKDLADTKVLSAGTLETLHQINTNPRQYGFVDGREITFLNCQRTDSRIGSYYRDTIEPPKGPDKCERFPTPAFIKLFKNLIASVQQR